MKQLALLLVLCYCSTVSYSQKLGFSSISSISSSSNSTDHQLYYNVGESLNSTYQANNLKISEGLFNCYSTNSANITSINITFFFDANENGIKDTDERNLSIGGVKVDNILYNNFSSQGISFSAAGGLFSIEYDGTNLIGWNLTTDNIVNVELTDENDAEYVSFGIAPDQFISKARTCINSGNFRCNEKVSYNFIIINDGFIFETNVAWLQIDSRIDSIIFPEPPDFIISDHLFGWNFDLEPTKRRTIKYCVVSPPIESNDQVGDIYTTKSWIGPDLLRNGVYCYDQEHRCSFDPNDKLVGPSRPDNLNLIDSTLFYTIRFQNTGNDYAKNVVVTDTLDNSLDLSTFRLLSTSHPRELKVIFTESNDFSNIINFEFKNIFLLDSISNEPASHGHIMFSIDHVEGLDLETEINNTGHIYFDFNPAVVTNTTSNILVDEFPTSSTFEPIYQTLLAYPNPTNGIINFKKTFDNINIFDVEGKRLGSYQNVQKIDLREFPNGVYILKASRKAAMYKSQIILQK